ncbi:hypothetical protein QWY31_01630 [Cytophagales bacterium LB-30]|uniref:Uncharacterized protein n=1 Tax=Shiella aurantiaca TaxID=3058365 RepID=A0ABT8F1K5_9BACT|nr:hypothetical protein [Shiella aurantiaca]MDN4164178.1 hypothetical protein [Shiella aurantiaca]
MKLFGTNTRSIKTWLFENFVDFLGIFISIILAFTLENYGEEQKEREKESVYLKSMYENLNSDIHKMEIRVYDYEKKMEACLTIIQSLDAGYVHHKDTIITLLNRELDYINLHSPDNSTYESLKYSGDLRLITNSNFKIMLSELDKNYTSLDNQGAELVSYVRGPQWRGFLLDNIDIKTSSSLDNSEHFQIQFNNRTIHLFKLLEIYYYGLSATIGKAEQVKTALEEEMLAKEVVFTKYEDEEN